MSPSGKSSRNCGRSWSRLLNRPNRKSVSTRRKMAFLTESENELCGYECQPHHRSLNNPKKYFLACQSLIKDQPKNFQPPAMTFRFPLPLTIFTTHCDPVTYRQADFPPGI